MLNKNSKGLSLLEAFVAAIVFVISVSAIFATLRAMRRPAVNNELAVGGALALSNLLDDLRAKIDTRDVSGADYVANLSTSGNPHGPIIYGQYNMYYNVAKDASTGMRTVTANVTWNDAF